MDALATRIAPRMHLTSSVSFYGTKTELNSRALVRIPRRKSWVVLVSGKQRGFPEQGKSRRAKAVVEEPPRKNWSPTIPNPPAGFILNDAGEVVLVAPANKRVVDMIDPETGRSLECSVRRAFLSSSGLQCLLLSPLDTPLQILKYDEENEALREISDDELEELIPTAEYALAKKRLHFVFSGYCLTARGCFCFTDNDVLELETGTDGSITEGVEITSFQVGISEFVVFTPFDPLLFVACKDESTGALTVADEDLMNDLGVVNAMKDEAEFQQFVEGGG
ncbi:uncharacterized protein LOC112343496 isoform X2 [Selaginella moellendorffii]|uniref:uncharacterized protein LOC112343496 isoform X2 n=1 Tax=Selaginella moellendorffii TaxID=88036 RepID=UPI000D1C34A6|nr:uncharacterized protein LOC112343496 isoform X2 [Selaginella moellendorffii]|eukprot:XP_024522824.1 uncharacterized protein LOC112343496 isoform X2 [Selaginella moellendorffii]